ncbi:MAG TPA: extracellular solute-binding protein, partial [Armatimonadaceae bacterium]|nr:extracellular solute-binding protein [Armatimonadaceae bacterium]
MQRFPYGGAALALLLLALLSGAYILANPVPKKTATLTFWTFAKPHFDAYSEAIPAFEKAHPGVKVDIQLVSGEATSRRLRAAFWADLDVPDLVETEISTAGTFFRGSLENIGFVDLTDRIEAEGWDEKMVAARFAPYTTRGRIFGLPHDVHPVMLAYRRDLYEKHGIDASKLDTWDKFVAAARKVSIPGKRYMLELPDADAGRLEILLFQRDGGYFDRDGKVIFDNEVAVETMLFYVPLVAGKGRIGNALGWGQETNRALEDGFIMTMFAPDWRTKTFENEVGAVEGKMALMPLPAVKPGGRRTSTWGGTMLGITKASRNQDLAWELAKFLYTSDRDLAERFAGTNIIPPVRSAWDLPEFKRPNAYYGGIALGTAYAKLAPETPPQYGSPFVELAKQKLGQAVVACVARYNQQGEKGFEEFARATLKGKADEVRRVMARTP